MHEAEARTPSAQGRQSRIITNSLLSITFLIFIISNYTLSSNDGIDSWVKYIPFVSSTWGRYVDAVGVIYFSTMVVFEFWTREIVAQSIYAEFKKRGNSFE